ncbi:MAG: hypothetical protein CME62_13425 [Halobacteriovoraceae bacterium]|nr:hypothetical protein [Halobacteriovoraceae bacterium]|tara:strand:- start:12053 stop:12568 length:516 start_codon:yes stop_codon:yes gene_type:complete
MNTAFHISTRTIDSKWFQTSIKDVWSICKRSLVKNSHSSKVDIISFVLMQNHYHLLLKADYKSAKNYVSIFNKQVSHELKTHNKFTQSVLANDFKLELIKNPTYLANCYRYIYQNPVRANVVKSCENYPYSTLHYLAHNKKFGIPLCDRFGVKDQYALRWINEKLLTPPKT